MLYLPQLHDKIKNHSTFFEPVDDIANVANIANRPNAQFKSMD